MMKRSACFRLLLCILLFLLTFAGKTQDLENYNQYFHRSRHPRPEFKEFEGIRFGITFEEFKQLAESRDSLKLLGDTTVDWGRKGSRRMKVYMKGEGYAGSIIGKYYLFGLDFMGHEKALGHAFFSPGDERLHRIVIYFPDRLYSDMGDIEAVVRQLYEHYGKEFGVPDYVPGYNNGDWGPQKKEALTKENLNHPRVSKGSIDRTFAGWGSTDGEWMVHIAGHHFDHDKNRYQAVLILSHNYTKGF